MANLTPAQIKAAKARGAKADIIPKHVQVSGLEALAAQLVAVCESNNQSNSRVLAAIESLTCVIANKESKDLNTSGIIEALSSLKRDREPLDIVMNFERNDRREIESGVRFTEVPRELH